MQDGNGTLPIEIVHASERVTMEDGAAKAFRAKRDSSLRIASRLVRDGVAQGFVSAGNTGAVMATAKIVQGVVPGVERPALVGILPTAEGTPVVLVDVGANVDCTPRMLGQFAVMARGAHGDGEVTAVDADLKRLFDGKQVLGGRNGIAAKGLVNRHGDDVAAHVTLAYATG